jgi:hypothetical protein
MITIHKTIQFLCFGLCYSAVHCETVDIPPPNTRVVFVAKIQGITQSRGKEAQIPPNVSNPFFRTAPEVVVAHVEEAPVPAGLSGPELLSQLSSKIPSTGTLVFGGNTMLLLGSKRVKIGEKIIVSRDGKDYELTLSGVTSTTYTVKMGEEMSTRPIRNR